MNKKNSIKRGLKKESNNKKINCNNKIDAKKDNSKINDKKNVNIFKNKKIYIIILFILISLIVFSYSLYNYRKDGLSKDLVLGNIYMHYNEEKALTIADAVPGADYSDYFEFTISGKNTYTMKDIWYDIAITKGEVPSGKLEENRIPDKYLMFRLTSVNDDSETVIFTDNKYEDLNKQIIHIETVPKNTINHVNKKYRLYVKIDYNIEIGNSDTSIFTFEEWNNAFASVKVDVTGDFGKRSLAKSGAEKIIDTYGKAKNLIAINTSGTLYDGLGTVREYRYSGSTANNYVIFNDDGDNVREPNELWRIVGVFKNSRDEWNIKLMRNSVLSYEEIPMYYTINGTEYTILYDESDDMNTVFYNNDSETNNNSWATAGLQYFLNTIKDSNNVSGYYSTITENADLLIDKNYTYNLGNFVYGRNGDTAISSYNSERGKVICPSNLQFSSHESNCNIWFGNEVLWQGAVSLLYPSDYGYSVDSKYWQNSYLYNYNTTAISSSSWMNKTANHYIYEWLLSPASMSNYNNLYWNTGGNVFSCEASFDNAVRPVLNLLETTDIDINHEGSINDPYIIG